MQFIFRGAGLVTSSVTYPSTKEIPSVGPSLYRPFLGLLSGLRPDSVYLHYIDLLNQTSTRNQYLYLYRVFLFIYTTLPTSSVVHSTSESWHPCRHPEAPETMGL